MKKLILILGMMTSIQASDFGSWNYLFLTWKAGDQWTTHLYLDHEKLKDKDAGSLLSLRMRRVLDERFKIGFNYGQYHIHSKPIHHRFEFAFFYCEKWGNLSLNHRSRFERWFYESNQKNKYRYRHLWSLSYPLGVGLTYSISNDWMSRTAYSHQELPWEQEHEFYQNWFDPVGLTYKINTQQKIKAFYRFSNKESSLEKNFDLSESKQYIGLAYFLSFK